MSDKNFIYAIKGLQVPRDCNFAKLSSHINEYIAVIPELAESLTASLDAGRKDELQKQMSRARAMLFDVYAKMLCADADVIISVIRRNNMTSCGKMLPSFVTDLLSLSIEMQLAQTRQGDPQKQNKSKIETFTDIANNLSAIGKLISLSEHDRALDMLSCMRDTEDNNLQDTDIGVELTNSLLLGRNGKAAELIAKLKSDCVLKIEQLGGSWAKVERKILAVDDRPDVLASVSGILKSQYKVFCAPGGDAALKLMKFQNLDLFLLDIDMPGMDGYTLSCRIREIHTYKKTPILFLTSNASRACVYKAIESGGNDFIVKPANRITLTSKVGKYLL